MNNMTDMHMQHMQPAIKLQKLDLNMMFNEDAPAPDYVLPGMLNGTVGMVVAAGATGKSMWVLEAAISITCGVDVFGILGGDPVQGRVVYLCAEDQEPVLHTRLRMMAVAIRARYGAHADAYLHLVEDNLDVVPVFGLGLTVGGLEDAHWSCVVDFCKDARLSILDTLIRYAGGANENDNVAMGGLMTSVEQTVRATGSSFLLLHHVGKGAARDGTAGGDQTATRGASSLTDNCRWQANLATMSVEAGAKRGLDPVARRMWVSFEPTKTNYGPPIDSVWFHRENGGLLVHGEPPEAVQGGRI